MDKSTKMKQLIQNFKTGELYVDDVPLPAIKEGMVLVENQFSLISAGTERGTVKVAQSNLIGKARQRGHLSSDLEWPQQGHVQTWHLLLVSVLCSARSTSGDMSIIRPQATHDD